MLTQRTDPSAHAGSGGTANALALGAVPDSGVITQSGPMLMESHWFKF